MGESYACCAIEGSFKTSWEVSQLDFLSAFQVQFLNTLSYRGHAANSQFGGILPTEDPSEQILASAVQKTGSAWAGGADFVAPAGQAAKAHDGALRETYDPSEHCFTSAVHITPLFIGSVPGVFND